MHAGLQSRRVFIGLKMSEELADSCMHLHKEFGDLPARFAKREDLHVTLVPPFDITDQNPVESIVMRVLKDTRPFVLKLTKLDYGPTPGKPRLAWVECEPAEELVELRKKLVEAFEYEDRYAFRPHITIARFKDRDRHLLKGHVIEKLLNLSMVVRAVELFESVHREGVTYRILASYAFP